MLGCQADAEDEAFCRGMALMEKYNLTYDCVAVGAGDPSLTLPMLVLARFDCGGGVALRSLGALAAKGQS